MARLGKGQAILGGKASNNIYLAKIYSLTCSNRNCIILLLDRELSVPRDSFVAIPISDTITGCITGGGKIFQKISKKIYTSKHLFNLELVSKELNHLAAILHVYAGGLNFMK